MKLSDAITKANARASELQGLRLKSDDRSRLTASLFAIAQQHQSAIILLLSNPQTLQASAFSLLRLLLEVTIRGVWVLHCATEDQVRNVIEGNQKQLDTKSMFAAVEKALNKDSECNIAVTKLYDHWKVLSDLYAFV
ncbi:MAG: hypothetical protein Q8N35_09970 [Methylococcaceae bacterium]|nr:hypothetical protein [Methylococcaceae bacterium]MDZ4155929.1 hypothetical protein [Methylococcales bacterium]MDP2392735.1 hypothetical protein [Methylococcaceae bacterium]MDP3019905.1 hypothetical protein [Methylococcaceae bacterium]MDP3389900.1 hypothetical protein [Methylococcaceae bacterium]